MKIIVASHGTLASGLKNSAELIIGEKDNIVEICAYVDPNIDYQVLIKSVVESHDYIEEKLVVLTDILGGSVNTEFLKYINDYEFLLVSGMNLPLLIELALKSDVSDIELKKIVQESKENMKLFSKLSLSDIDDDDFL